MAAPCSWRADLKELLHAFLVRHVGGDFVRSNEVDEIAWLHVDEMQQRVRPAYRQRVMDALEHTDDVPLRVERAEREPR